MSSLGIVLIASVLVGQPAAYQRANPEDAKPNAKQLALVQEELDREKKAALSKTDDKQRADAAKPDREQRREAYLAEKRRIAEEKKRARDARKRDRTDDKPEEKKPDPWKEAGGHLWAEGLDHYGDMVKADFKIRQVMGDGALLVVERSYRERAIGGPGGLQRDVQTIEHDFIVEGVDTKDAMALPDGGVTGWFWYANKATYETVTGASRTLPLLRAIPETVAFR